MKAMKEYTVIKVGKDTAKELVELKIHPRETYEDVIKRLIKKWKSTQES